MLQTAPASSKTDEILCFGSFELDVRAGQLRKRGMRVKLQRQPFEVLTYLARHAGEVVTREELQSAIWPSDTFVDFDQGLNRSINKIRAALNDDVGTPRFIETLSGKGYRFVAPVSAGSSLPGTGEEGSSVAIALPAFPQRSKSLVGLLLAGAIVAIAAFVSLLAWNRSRQKTELPVHVQSVVVLPLQNLSGDPSQEYFADGMTDELITQLAKIGSIRVISRTSAMHYKDSRKSLPEIARELNVEAVVEGSVVHSGNRVRLTAQLIDGLTDRHLWAESYERDFRDIVPLQGELARAIASQISAELATQKTPGQTATHPADPEAQEAYLKGRYYLNQPTDEELSKSLAYFEQAVERDPDYAPGYAGLADAYVRKLYVGVPAKLVLPKARTAAEKALQLDPTLAEPHAALGLVKAGYDYDWSGAETEFKRAIALNSGSALAHYYYSFGLMALGRNEEAIAEMKKAVSLDPLSPAMNAHLGSAFVYARNYDQGIEQFKRTQKLDPNLFYAHGGLMEAYEEKAMYPEALAEFQRTAELSGYRARFLNDIDRAYENSGVTGYWQMRRRFIEESPNQANLLTEAAIAYARTGDKERALQSLQKAIAQREFRLILLNVEPAFDSLHSDPRFQDLLRRMNFPADKSQLVQGKTGAGSMITVPTNFLGVNLIANSGAEDGEASTGYAPPSNIPGWTKTAGNFTVEAYGAPDGFPDQKSPGPSDRGKNFFAGGHNCAFASATQSIDVSAGASLIDAKKVGFTLSGFLGGFHNQNDTATLTATFKDANGRSLGTSKIGPVTARDRKFITGLLPRHVIGSIPPGTHTVVLELSMKRVEPYYNDGYADNLTLVLNTR